MFLILDRKPCYEYWPIRRLKPPVTVFQMSSVDHLLQCYQLCPELDISSSDGEVRPSSTWPQYGIVTFEGVSASNTSKGPSILRNMWCCIRAQEKVPASNCFLNWYHPCTMSIPGVDFFPRKRHVSITHFLACVHMLLGFRWGWCSSLRRSSACSSPCWCDWLITAALSALTELKFKTSASRNFARRSSSSLMWVSW